MTYEEQLLDERWINKREVILHRDNRQCQVCLSDKNPHVHHKTYISGHYAWEYPSYLLITLCGDCHEKFHNVKRHSEVKEDMLQIAARAAKSIAAAHTLRSIEAGEFIRKVQFQNQKHAETFH